MWISQDQICVDSAPGRNSELWEGSGDFIPHVISLLGEGMLVEFEFAWFIGARAAMDGNT